MRWLAIFVLAMTSTGRTMAQCNYETNPLACINVLDPSLTKELFRGPVPPTGEVTSFWSTHNNYPFGGAAFDAAGNFYTIAPPNLFRYRPNGTRETIATMTSQSSLSPMGVGIDLLNGKIYLAIWEGGGSYSSIVALTGLPRLFEVFQSYTPAVGLSFTVPGLPEGFPTADHFDTYYGALTNPIDFTQAQPLQCGYPASPPSVGDYLAVADSLQAPAPGQGRYYVTAVTYQGQRRYGRQRLGGVLSGRNPALLPACTR